MSGDAGAGDTGSDASTGAPDGGTYSLLIDLAAPAAIEVGALGDRPLDAGVYAYTGSALGAGGFSRVDRHRRTARDEHDVRHWHVDHLLGDPDVRVDRVVRSVGTDVECAVAERLPAGPVDGFGASDCGCESHLAAGDEGESLDAFAARVRDAHEAAVGSDDAGAAGESEDAAAAESADSTDYAESDARVDVVAGE